MLMRFPRPHADEAWMASRAWEFIQTGSTIGPLDRGVLDQIEGYRYFYPWLPTAIQSLGVRLIGEPSLFAIRLVSLFIGFFLLLAIYFIGLEMDGKKLGILAVISTAFSYAFFFSAHFGRADIIAATFGYAGLALLLNNRKPKEWLSALSGLLMIFAFEVHAYAAIFVPTALALYLWKYKSEIFRKTDFWSYIGGVTIGMLVYLGYHVFPAPQAFLKLNQVLFISTRTPPILTFDYSIIIGEFKEMALMVVVVYPQIFLGIWAIFRLRKKRPAYLSTLLILTGVMLMSFILLVQNKFLLYYGILYSPALSLLFAAFFNDFLKKTVKSKAEHYLRHLIVIGILILPVGYLIRFNSLPPYLKIQSELNSVVEPGDSIMANQLYWFGLSDYRYNSWGNIVYYRRFKPGSRLDDLLKLLQPDLFIIDGHVAGFITDEIEGEKYFLESKVPKSELEEFFDQYASLIKIINIENEDPVQIFRIHWDQVPMD